MPNPRLKFADHSRSLVTVFVCGTYTDLSAERGAVLDAIQRLQLSHDSMEFFGARSSRPIDTCLNEVGRSDIMVVIVGARYGSLVPGLGISYSEAEYNEAHRLRLPCLVYVKEAVPAAESGPDEERMLARWKTTLRERHTVYPFRQTSELAVQVAADLGRAVAELQTNGPARRPKTAQRQQQLSTQVGSEVKLRYSRSYGDAQRQLLHGLSTDPSGNVVIGGDFWGQVNFGGPLLRSSGDRDIFVAKFDHAGTHLWSRSFGDAAEQCCVGVQTDGTGAIFLASAFKGSLDFGGGALISRGDYNIALAKLGPDGRHVWSRCYGDRGYHVPECIAVSPSGTAVVAGRFKGVLDFGPAQITSVSTQVDIFMACFSADGDFLWAKRIGGPHEQQTRAIAIDRTGSIALVGVFKGEFDVDGCRLEESGPGEYCGFLAEFDERGTARWCKRLGEPAVEQGGVVAFDPSSSHIVAAGFIRNKLPPALTNQGTSLCYFARYDHTGVIQWSKTFGKIVFPTSVTVSQAGYILLTGYFADTADFGVGRMDSAGGYDIFAALFNSDGNPIWSQRFGDLRQQFLVDGSITNNAIVLAGSFHGTIDFGNGALTASGYNGLDEGNEDAFLAIFELESAAEPTKPAFRSRPKSGRGPRARRW